MFLRIKNFYQDKCNICCGKTTFWGFLINLEWYRVHRWLILCNILTQVLWTRCKSGDGLPNHWFYSYFFWEMSYAAAYLLVLPIPAPRSISRSSLQKGQTIQGLFTTLEIRKYEWTLTRISCKDLRKSSNSNFIVLFSFNSKMEHFMLNFMNLVPGVFELRYSLFM